MGKPRLFCRLRTELIVVANAAIMATIFATQTLKYGLELIAPLGRRTYLYPNGTLWHVHQ
jgi:hypothetical protein